MGPRALKDRVFRTEFIGRRDLATDSDNAAIVTATIAMRHALNLSVARPSRRQAFNHPISLFVPAVHETIVQAGVPGLPELDGRRRDAIAAPE